MKLKRHEHKKREAHKVMQRRQEIDIGVRPGGTTSPSPAQSVGRPSFIKWQIK